MGPCGMLLCSEVFHDRGPGSSRKTNTHCRLFIRVVSKSCFSKGRISALTLPGRYVVHDVRQGHGGLLPRKRALIPNSRIRVRVSTRSVRGLCRPLIDVTGVCWVYHVGGGFRLRIPKKTSGILLRAYYTPYSSTVVRYLVRRNIAPIVCCYGPGVCPLRRCVVHGSRYAQCTRSLKLRVVSTSCSRST